MGWASVFRAGVLGFMALTLAACGEGDLVSPVPGYLKDPVALKRGKGVFVGTCGAYCHKSAPGPGDIPYLFDCAWKNGGTDLEIFRTIRDGVSGTQMIGFDGALPGGNDDIWKIIAYLRSKADCP